MKALAGSATEAYAACDELDGLLDAFIRAANDASTFMWPGRDDPCRQGKDAIARTRRAINTLREYIREHEGDP